MQTEIKNEWTYQQPPEKVWEYLTQSELIALWLMPNDFKPIAEYEFQFKTKPIPALDLDGIFHCRIIEIHPFQKLIYTWKGGSGNGIFTLDTLVEWNLEKYGSGTKLFLKQSGFKETNLAIFNAMTSGWDTNIKKMITFLNTNDNDSKHA